MHRIIKFRGRSKANYKHENIKVGDWVYGSYINSGCDVPCIIFGDGSQAEIDVKTLGQFTGLKDQNDMSIFEGDIVEVNLCAPEVIKRAVVKYEIYGNIGQFGFDSNEEGFEYGGLFVVGNIHEHPNLLKGKAS